MPAPLSNDIRIRIVEAHAQLGLTYDQLAEQFRVGRASVDRVLRLARETGSVEPAPHGGGVPRRIREAHGSMLRELLAARPDTTLDDLCSMFAARTGIAVSASTMSRALRQLGWTRKKNRWWRASAARPRSPRSARLSWSSFMPATQST